MEGPASGRGQPLLGQPSNVSWRWDFKSVNLLWVQQCSRLPMRGGRFHREVVPLPTICFAPV